MNILFVSPRFPLPTVKGDQVVLINRLKHLSERHRITLVTFKDKEVDGIGLSELSNYCDIILVPRSMIDLFWDRAFSCPLQVLLYSCRKLRQAIIEEISGNYYNIIHVITLRPWLAVEGLGVPVVADLIDSMQYNMRELMNEVSWAKRLIYRYEWLRLKKFEPYVIANSVASIYVSDIDRAYAGGGRNVYVVPNGVDCSKFAPFVRCAEKIISFSGNMGYAPNVDAVLWFERIYDKLREVHDGLIFKIIGAGWDDRLNNLRKREGIEFTGYVENLGYELANSLLVVAPMQIGSGMQNKVLEAMACGLPIVVTNHGRGAIRLIHEQHALIVDDDLEFELAVSTLLTDDKLRDYLGGNARQLALEQYSWEASHALVEEIYADVISSVR